MLKRYWLGLLFLCSAGLVLAVPDMVDQGLDTNISGIFVPQSLDLSINYLRMIFGTVGNVLIGTGNELISKLFYIFNMGLLVFVGGFVSYTVFRSVMNTAQDGGMAAGQGKSGNAWTVFRIVLGVSLLVPMYEGYSLAQVTVMWSVIQGVGLADTMWTYTANALSKNGGALMSPPQNEQYSDLTTLAGPYSSLVSDANMSNLMHSALCLATLDKATAMLAGKGRAQSSSTAFSNNAVSFYPAVRKGLSCGTNSPSAVCFGFQGKANSSGGEKLCGVYDISQGLKSSPQNNIVQNVLFGTANSYYYMMKEQLSRIEALIVTPGSQNTVSSTVTGATLSGFLCQFLNSTTLKPVFVSGSMGASSRVMPCLPGIALATGASHYYAAIKPARQKDVGTRNVMKAWRNTAVAGGWVTAGQSYHKLVTTPNAPPATLKPVGQYLFSGPSSTVDQALKTFFMMKGVGISSSPDALLEFAKKCANKSLAQGNGLPLGNWLTSSQRSLLGGTALKIEHKMLGGGSFEGGLTAACLIYTQLQQYDLHAKYQIESMKASSLMGRLTGYTIASNGAATSGSSSDDTGTLKDADGITAQALQIMQSISKIGLGDFEKTSTTGDIPLNIVPQNIQVMLFKVLSALLGLDALDTTNGASAAYNDGSKNAGGDTFTVMSKKGTCFKDATFTTSICPGLTKNTNDCFEKAVKSKCIQPGVGILGAMASAQKGEQVDQVLLLTTIGTELLDSSILFWTTTTSGLYLVGKAVTKSMTIRLIELGAAATVGSGMLSAAQVLGGNFATVAGGVGLGAAGGVIIAVANATAGILKMWNKFDMMSLAIYVPFGTALAGLFFGIGISMGLYLPLIPFLTFLFSVIGWLIAVIEAMVAAPLVGLGVTHPEGHDLLGKAEQSVMLLLGIFVRPAAMLLGFIMAVVLSYVAMELLNTGFISVMLNYLTVNSTQAAAAATGAAGTTVKLIGFSGILLVYAYVSVSVIQQCFAMIYQVPERLLRWIGVSEQPGSVGQMLGETKGGLSQAGGQVSQGAGGAMSGATSGMRAEGSDAQSADWSKDKGKGDKAETDDAPDAGGPGEAGAGGGGANE